MKPRILAACAALLCGISIIAAAAPVNDTALDSYLAGLATLRVDFTQTLTDGRGRKVEAVAGSLIVQRPGRFRWEVRPAASKPGSPFTQLMVADGRNVWFFDRDLEQVTVRAANGALTATPAMLLSGTMDLRTAFELRAAPRNAGLDWVIVKPKRADAEFREARLGFATGELRRMDLLDKLGQTAIITFAAARRNAPVQAAELTFTPPAGVDVIGKPVG